MSDIRYHNTGMTATVNQADVAEVKRLLGEFSDKYKAVLTTSINKTLTTARTQATARIGNELNLKAARIKQDFTLQKANYSKLSGALIAKGAPVGLVQFGANQTQKGVSVKVLRSSPRTLIRHAFIAKGRGRSISTVDGTVKEHVFWRDTPRGSLPAPRRFPTGKMAPRGPWGHMADKYRLSLERLTGPRIEDIFANPKVLHPVTIQAQHVYLQNVDAKIKEIIYRYG